MFWRRKKRANSFCEGGALANSTPKELPKKTLVLDMDETLIHSSIFPPKKTVEGFKSGEPPFYVHKRPGLDEFLKKASERFDVFIFTFAERSYAEPILDVVCPFIDKEHRFYRDQCKVEKGAIMKDLEIFGRPKTDVILVDDNKDNMKFFPKNTILVPGWRGSPYDDVLVSDVIPTLEMCSTAKDVRPIIAQFVKRRKRRASE